MDAQPEKSVHIITTTEHSTVSVGAEEKQNASDDDSLSTQSPSPEAQPSSDASQPSALSRWFANIFDGLLVVIPIALMVKIVLCIVASHIDSGSTGYWIDDVHPITMYLIKFNAQLTTLFPVIFVTIVSTFVRRVALWRAQRGATVAELEQWQASISLPSTFKTIYSLSMYNVTSLILVLIWSWYYLGSQATVREYKYQEAGAHSSMNITLTNPTGLSYFEEKYFSTLNNSQKFSTEVMFAAAAAAASGSSTQTLAFDVNGAMLIPEMRNNFTNADWKGFYSAMAPSDAAWVSWLGVQTYAVLMDSDSAYSNRLVGKLAFNYSYIQTNCEPMQFRNISEFPAGVLDPMAVSLNASTDQNSFVNGFPTFEAWYRNSSSKDIQAMSATCNFTIINLAVKADCNAQGCTAKKLKQIPTWNPDPLTSVLTNPNDTQRFFNEMLLATGTPSNQNDQTFAEYIAWPGSVIHLPNGNSTNYTEFDVLRSIQPQNINATAKLFNMSIANYSAWAQEALYDYAGVRTLYTLTPLVNTFLTAYQQSDYVTAAIKNSVGDADRLAVYDGRVANPWLSVGTLKGTYWNPSYALSITWIILDFLSCSVLLAVGISCVWLRTRIIAPDIFGYVSSLTIDNPNVDAPHVCSTLSGFERAKMLRDFKVQLADVKAGQEVGRVSLMQANGDSRSTNPHKLSKNRKYV